MAQAKIAIIEDELILLQALSTELTREGFEIVSATDGEAGLKIVEEEQPDLIILDIILPNKNGFEVLEEFKTNEKTKKIPVIILSNLGQSDDLRKGLELGAEDYFVKSATDLANLATKIRKILAK